MWFPDDVLMLFWWFNVICVDDCGSSVVSCCIRWCLGIFVGDFGPTVPTSVRPAGFGLDGLSICLVGFAGCFGRQQTLLYLQDPTGLATYTPVTHVQNMSKQKNEIWFCAPATQCQTEWFLMSPSNRSAFAQHFPGGSPKIPQARAASRTWVTSWERKIRSFRDL